MSGSEQQQILNGIRDVLEGFPGITFEANTFLTERIDETISGYTAPVAVNIYGNDLNVLDEKARRLAALMNGIEGASDIQVRSPPGAPQIRVEMNLDRLKFWGVTPKTVLDSLRIAYETQITGRTLEGSRIFNIAVALSPSLRERHEALRRSSGSLKRKTIERLGGLRSVEVDFRLVAATNKDLRSMMDRDEFREDLFYRLNTMMISIPPLSERPEYVAALVNHFLESGKASYSVTDPAMKMLHGYSWPGNVRELKNVIERAVSLAEGDRIDVEQLPFEVRSFEARCRRESASSPKPLVDEMSCYQKELITDALRKTKGNMARTAKLLGISRSTLYEKCKVFGL